WQQLLCFLGKDGEEIDVDGVDGVDVVVDVLVVVRRRLGRRCRCVGPIPAGRGGGGLERRCRRGSGRQFRRRQAVVARQQLDVVRQLQEHAVLGTGFGRWFAEIGGGRDAEGVEVVERALQ